MKYSGVPSSGHSEFRNIQRLDFSCLDFYCSLRFMYGADYLNHGPLEPKASVLPMSNADPPGVVIWDPGPIL